MPAVVGEHRPGATAAKAGKGCNRCRHRYDGCEGRGWRAVSRSSWACSCGSWGSRSNAFGCKATTDLCWATQLTIAAACRKATSSARRALRSASVAVGSRTTTRGSCVVRRAWPDLATAEAEMPAARVFPSLAGPTRLLPCRRFEVAACRWWSGGPGLLERCRWSPCGALEETRVCFAPPGRTRLGAAAYHSLSRGAHPFFRRRAA